MGLHVTARAGAASALGVSVYDVLAAIHKQFKKKVRFLALLVLRFPLHLNPALLTFPHF